MLRLVHPAPEGQGPRTRKGRRRSSPLLSHEESIHLRAALRNLARAFGTWDCLAEVLGFSTPTLHNAASANRPKASPALALRVAKVSGMSVEAILGGTLSAAGRCETCGHRIGDGRFVRAAGGAS